MYDGASNVQLAGEVLKNHYTNLSVMRGVEHTVSLFFNEVTKIPVVNQVITAHKSIYNLFGSGIYHKPHSLFKSISYKFHNTHIGLFSGNDNRMAGYFTVMYIYSRMIKSVLVAVSSDEFNTMALYLKFYKVVSYI